MTSVRRPTTKQIVVAAALLVGAFYCGAQWGLHRFLATPARASVRRRVPPSRPQAVPAPVARQAGRTGAGLELLAARLWGDFQPQSAVILGCNELVTDHPDVFVDVVRGAHRDVRLIGLIANDVEREIATQLLEGADLPSDAIELVEVPVETIWTRDYGPIFVRRHDGTAAIVDSVYVPGITPDEPPVLDDGVPVTLGNLLGLPVVSTPLVVQGGNLLTNGDGLAVTTTFVCEENRPFGCTEERVGEMLADSYGFKRWVYLEPLVGEPTHHVDMFVAILGTNLAVVAACDPNEDPVNARILDEAAEILGREMTAAGRMQVHRIPMPPRPDGVWRTFTNLILTDKIALIPTYSTVDKELHREALDVYRRLLPRHKVIAIDTESLAPLGGSLHCISMNVPGFVRLPKRLESSAATGGGARSLRSTVP